LHATSLERYVYFVIIAIAITKWMMMMVVVAGHGYLLAWHVIPDGLISKLEGRKCYFPWSKLRELLALCCLAPSSHYFIESRPQRRIRFFLELALLLLLRLAYLLSV
jgi:hypothetical protein